MATPPAPSRTALGLGLLAVLLVSLAAAPAQAKYTYGSIVDKNDDDFTPASSVKASKVCFADDDGDGGVQPSEPLYLVKRAACGHVKGKEIRLVDTAGFRAGTESDGVTEADYDLALAPVPAHAFRFTDLDGDGKLKKKADAVYLDLTALGAHRVDVGDLRLSLSYGFPAGTRVAAGDADLDLPLKELPGAGCPCSTDTANIIVEMGKGTYLNVDRDAAGSLVEEGDVRLTANVPSWTNDLGAAPLKFTLTGMALPASLQPGQAFQLTGTVTNTDSVPGTAFLETRVDDALVDTRAAPLLMPTKTAFVVLTLVAPAEPGIHTVRLGDSAVAFNVLKAAEPATPEPVTSAANTTTAAAPLTSAAPHPAVASVGAPAAGLPVAVLGLAVVAGALLRRAA